MQSHQHGQAGSNYYKWTHEDSLGIVGHQKWVKSQLVAHKTGPICIMTSIDTCTRFTEELKSAAGEQWERLVNHKFTVELANGTIDPNGEYSVHYGPKWKCFLACSNRNFLTTFSTSFPVLKKHLIQDHRFIDSFVVLLASMVASCRKLEDRIPGCQFLEVITGKENTYFERSFDKLDCNNERKSTPDDEVTKKFIQLMRSVAKEGSLG